MSRKKKLLCVTLSLVMALSLSACGASKDKDQNNDAQKQNTVENSNVANSKNDQQKEENYVDFFNEKNMVNNDRLKELSKGGMAVGVSLGEQKVYIYEDGKVSKTMDCATGIDSSPTPSGTFVINGRGESFFSQKFGEGAYNWVNFLDSNYLFHSVPFDANYNIIPSEEDKLGVKASHGCIRLSLENSAWIYDNVPDGTNLIIE